MLRTTSGLCVTGFRDSRPPLVPVNSIPPLLARIWVPRLCTNVLLFITRFDEVSETLAPVDDGTADRCFISESYDATRYVFVFRVVVFMANTVLKILDIRC